jgi:IclR family pca regulon transcriptional regulator
MTLTELGYVTFDGKFFSPTPRVLRLGATYEETAQLPQLAQPHLAAIRNAVDESASLAVLQDDASLFIARSEATRILNTGVRVGARLPLYASATGHVLLAGLTDEDASAQLAKEELAARTPTTLTDSEAIAQRVREVRKEGYALTDEELELGVRSIAVPVLDSSGATVAALSVSAATARVSVDELRTRLFPVMQEHARLLGRQL